MKKSLLLTLFLILAISPIVFGQSETEKKVMKTEVGELDSLHAAACIKRRL